MVCLVVTGCVGLVTEGGVLTTKVRWEVEVIVGAGGLGAPFLVGVGLIGVGETFVDEGIA
jgi:hypothetical protein